MPQYLQLVTLGDQQFEPLSGPGLRIQGCALRSSGSYEEPRPGQTPLSNFSHYVPRKHNTRLAIPRAKSLGSKGWGNWKYLFIDIKLKVSTAPLRVSPLLFLA